MFYLQNMLGTLPFVGRESELSRLRLLLKKKTASLVVVKGRRRVGKSRLAQEFGKCFDQCVTLTGLPPDKNITAQAQRDDFAQQLVDELHIDRPETADWGHLLRTLARQVQKTSVLVILDELTWLGSEDATFLGKLKSVWDTHLSQNPRLILLLSGSMSLWLEENLLRSTGFVGRISLEVDLQPLPLDACPAFWGAHAERVSSLEMLRLLAVTGCIPRYLEEIIPSHTAEQNIQALCFEPDGLLFREFDRLFGDFFGERGDYYQRLTRCLGDGPLAPEKIYERLDLAPSGKILRHLDDLVSCGFVKRDYTWNVNTGVESKLSRYRLSDNYLRFYLKYVAPHRRRIERRTYKGPGAWPSIIALQFENLLMHSRHQLLGKIGVPLDEVVYDNPYFRRATKRAPGVQIDYMVQTRYKTIYMCEVKFSQQRIGSTVVDEVQKRLLDLRPPRGFSVRPVLIHVNGVTPSVVESEFFATILDFSTLLHT